MLRPWTSSKLEYLKKVSDPVLLGMKNRPPVRGLDFSEWDLYIPEEGEVVLAMGTKCLNHLKAAGIVPKNLSVTKARGRLFHAGEGKGCWMVTNDPYLTQREPSAAQEIQWDIRLACRYLQTGSLAPQVGRYRYVTDFESIIDYIEHDHDGLHPVRVFEDLETLGLWPWIPEAWIISISLTAGPGGADVITFPEPGQMPSKEVLEQIRWIETTGKVSLGGANLKFDNVWKRVKWGLPTPESYNYDTLLVGSLLDENRRNSLNMHAKVYTDMGGYDDAFSAFHDKSRMDLALAKDPDGFLLYAGGDTDAGARVREAQVELLLQDHELTDFYTTILHPAAKAFEAIEFRGVHCDIPQLREVGVEACGDAEDATADLIAMVPNWLKRKYAERFKLTPKILQEIFFSARGWDLTPKVATEKAPKNALEEGKWEWASTSIDDHLKMFSSLPEAGPFIKRLRDKNRAEKINSSYVEGFIKHLRPDGMFHSTYSLYKGSLSEDSKKGKDDEGGADTGRTSAKNPHVQTIPKKTKPGTKNWAKPLRRCFTAPPGKLLFEVDYDMGELKIAACFANEPTMIRLFKEGKDLHVMTGAQVNGLTYEEVMALKEVDPTRFANIRYGAKPNNFGFIYGQSPMGFRNYAYKQWDMDLSLGECERQSEIFFGTYRRLKAWHNSYILSAQENEYVRSPFGRIRHLPLINSKERGVANRAARQAVNSPVQSTLSDMCLWAIHLAEAELEPEGMEIALMVHDAIVGYVPDTDAGRELVLRLVWIMENLPITEKFEWEPQIPFTATAEVGPNLYDLTQLG